MMILLYSFVKKNRTDFAEIVKQFFRFILSDSASCSHPQLSPLSSALQEY
jgi:hypothetical protein